MPAIEVENVMETDEKERQSYELAFHVLPTIAEGEVATVFDSIKAVITSNGGEIFDEETPERFNLAYEIEKHLEGKNRKFHSAYFGWVRFKAYAEGAVVVNEAISGNTNILRHLLVKLTRIEEETPFRFHEALRSEKPVTNLDGDESTSEITEETDDITEIIDQDTPEEEKVI